MSDTSNTGQPAGEQSSLELDREGAETRRIDPDQMGELPPVDDVGQRIESFVSARTFIDKDQAQVAVAGKPRGYHVPLGRIAGYATSSERRENKAGLKGQDGQLVPASVWIKGEFEAVVLATGELRAARWLILPRAAGDLIEEAFAQGAQRAFLDIELGIEATGRTIPYTYTVTAYGGRDSEAKRMLRAIRARQEQRALQRAKALEIVGPKATDAKA